MNIKKEVLDYIKDHNGTTYVELEKLFDRLGFDWKGELTSSLPGYPNMISWTGWNIEAFDILSDLLDDNLIERNGASQIVYLIDGKGLTLPVAKQFKQYKDPRWMPVAYSVKGGKSK